MEIAPLALQYEQALIEVLTPAERRRSIACSRGSRSAPASTAREFGSRSV